MHASVLSEKKLHLGSKKKSLSVKIIDLLNHLVVLMDLMNLRQFSDFFWSHTSGDLLLWPFFGTIPSEIFIGEGFISSITDLFRTIEKINTWKNYNPIFKLRHSQICWWYTEGISRYFYPRLQCCQKIKGQLVSSILPKNERKQVS